MNTDDNSTSGTNHEQDQDHRSLIAAFSAETASTGLHTLTRDIQPAGGVVIDREPDERGNLMAAAVIVNGITIALHFNAN